jgi:hypothetical protein
MNDKITIKASEGKVLRRISDRRIFGKEISLGYTYYIGGKKLEEPLLELPEHFEEIDEPKPIEEILASGSEITEEPEELSEKLEEPEELLEEELNEELIEILNYE